MEIGDKIKTLVEVLDKCTVGLPALAPADLAGTKLLPSTIKKYAPPFSNRIQSLSLPLLYASVKEKFPQTTEEEFLEKFIHTPVGIEALQETLTYLAETLKQEIEVEDLKVIVEEIEKRLPAPAAAETTEDSNSR